MVFSYGLISGYSNIYRMHLNKQKRIQFQIDFESKIPSNFPALDILNANTVAGHICLQWNRNLPFDSDGEKSLKAEYTNFSLKYFNLTNNIPKLLGMKHMLLFVNGVWSSDKSAYLRKQ